MVTIFGKFNTNNLVISHILLRERERERFPHLTLNITRARVIYHIIFHLQERRKKKTLSSKNFGSSSEASFLFTIYGFTRLLDTRLLDTRLLEADNRFTN